jgi:hypothetical protein
MDNNNINPVLSIGENSKIGLSSSVEKKATQEGEEIKAD